MMLATQWRRFQTFRELSFAEKRILVASAIVLSSTVVGLRYFGYKRCFAWLQGWAKQRQWPPLAEKESATVRRTWILLYQVMRRSPLPGKCLSQSLTLWWLLKRQGIESDLRIGVQTEGGAFSAHAWIEVQGVPVNDKRDVHSRFAVFNNAVEIEMTQFVETEVSAS